MFLVFFFFLTLLISGYYDFSSHLPLHFYRIQGFFFLERPRSLMENLCYILVCRDVLEYNIPRYTLSTTNSLITQLLGTR